MHRGACSRKALLQPLLIRRQQRLVGGRDCAGRAGRPQSGRMLYWGARAGKAWPPAWAMLLADGTGPLRGSGLLRPVLATLTVSRIVSLSKRGWRAAEPAAVLMQGSFAIDARGTGLRPAY